MIVRRPMRLVRCPSDFPVLARRAFTSSLEFDKAAEEFAN
jgi:hypothetical protein